MNVTTNTLQPVLSARGLMNRYGTVVAMNGADFDLRPNEVLGVIHRLGKRLCVLDPKEFLCQSGCLYDRRKRTTERIDGCLVMLS